MKYKNIRIVTKSKQNKLIKIKGFMSQKREKQKTN